MYDKKGKINLAFFYFLPTPHATKKRPTCSAFFPHPTTRHAQKPRHLFSASHRRRLVCATLAPHARYLSHKAILLCGIFFCFRYAPPLYKGYRIAHSLRSPYTEFSSRAKDLPKSHSVIHSFSLDCANSTVYNSKYGKT